MAITDRYCSHATYIAIVSKSDTSEQTEIEDDLTAVSRFLDWKLGRRNGFSTDASATARTYYPQGSGGAYERTLFIDDVASTTGFELKVDEDGDGSFADETAWTINTDFVLWPLNADKGSTVKPWNAIYVPEWSTKSGFPIGKRVQVTYIGGWPGGIPKAIERATAHLTGILRIESPRATQRIPEAIDEAIQSSPTGQDIVMQLAAAYGSHETSGLAFS